MVKADIVSNVQDRARMLNREASAIVESIFKIMKDTLEAGEDVKISGFGTFKLKKKVDRQGRNPVTGEPMTIVARRVLSFMASQLLTKAVNGGIQLKRIVTWMILMLGFLSVPAFAANSATPNSKIDEGQLQGLQTKMLNDSQVMDLISALQNDPDIMALISDPVFVQAINTRNVDVLTSDPRFTKLFSNPRIKEIIKHVEK